MNTDIRLINTNNIFNKDASDTTKSAEALGDKSGSHEKINQSIAKSLNYVSSSRTSLQSNETSTSSLQSVSYSFSSSTTLTNNILHQELKSKLSSFNSSELSLNLHGFDAAPFSPPSPEEVSKTVLGFIENRIKLEESRGASSERIDNLVSQAREGVEKGFEQATKQIEQLGLLDDALSEEITTSFQSISQGLDRIQASHTPALDKPTQVAPVEPKSNTIEQPKFVFPSHQKTATSASAYQHLYAQSESTSVQIQTQDGDIISINLSQLYASLEEGSRSSNSKGNNAYSLSSHYQSSVSASEYQYSIEGELDDGEVKALTDLLVQIESLAGQFFSGDFQGAFENALTLGFDSSEIASFSLNLNITQVEQISTYERISNTTPSQDQISHPLSSLSSFAENFTSLNERILENFNQSENMLTDLLNKMVDDRFAAKTEKSSESEPDNGTLISYTDNLKAYLLELLNPI